MVARTCKRAPIDALRQNIRPLLLQTFLPFEILKFGFISHLGISTFVAENHSTHASHLNVAMWREVEYRAGLLSYVSLLPAQRGSTLVRIHKLKTPIYAAHAITVITVSFRK